MQKQFACIVWSSAAHNAVCSLVQAQVPVLSRIIAAQATLIWSDLLWTLCSWTLPSHSALGLGLHYFQQHLPQQALFTYTVWQLLYFMSFSMKICQSTWMWWSHAVEMKKLKDEDVFSWVMFIYLCLNSPVLNTLSGLLVFQWCVHTVLWYWCHITVWEQTVLFKKATKFTWGGWTGNSDKNQKTG